MWQWQSVDEVDAIDFYEFIEGCPGTTCWACMKLTFDLWNLQMALQLINPFPNKPWFLRVCSTSLLKTLWEKEKLLVTSNFSFSHSVFYPFGKLSLIFIQFEIVVCRLFQFGPVSKFVVWERVKENSCANLFWNPHIKKFLSREIRTDRWALEHIHINRRKWHCENHVLHTESWLNKNNDYATTSKFQFDQYLMANQPLQSFHTLVLGLVH